MRTAFIKELAVIARENPRLMLVVGDLGFSVIEEFAKEFPSQFLNAAVAEQNMTGMSAGLALGGSRTVFTYSIGNFPTLRCLEQVRNDVCYHNANVKVVSVGSGLAYGTLGFSHFGIEDIAIMRSLPNITVVSPADPVEARILTRIAAQSASPWYIRLGKNNEKPIHAPDVVLTNGKSIVLHEGNDGTIFSTGSVTYNVYQAVLRLAQEGLNLRCVSMPFIKPIDSARILESLATSPFLVTVEEHRLSGGFGSAVAEVIADRATRCPLFRLGLPEQLESSGTESFLREKYGLGIDGIANFIKGVVKR